MNRKRILTIFLTLLTFAGIGSAAVASPVFAATSTSTDTSSTIMQWMPTIITFAMLGMVMGLLKKFGKI